MFAPTLYAAICSVAQSLRRRQQSRPNNGVRLVYSRPLPRLIRSGVNMTLDFGGFYVLWPWPLTFQTENWHSTYTHTHTCTRVVGTSMPVLIFLRFLVSSYETVRDRLCQSVSCCSLLLFPSELDVLFGWPPEYMDYDKTVCVKQFSIQKERIYFSTYRPTQE